MESISLNRRNFINQLGISTVGVSALAIPAFVNPKLISTDGKNLNHIGPLDGYTPHIGTVISMLDWLSDSVIRYNKKLTVEQLDYLHDAESNTIGSLMMHLAATEVIYQDITFKNLEDFSKENKERWNIAMELGKDAQEKIKGNPLSYYQEMYEEVRAKTKAEMKNRDDVWLFSGETKDWNWNNYCKWFHVAEHYANHRGQMTWYAKRLPK
ncbi:MAG: DUF664 domain-containing protein [Bacteroidota bacterium]